MYAFAKKTSPVFNLTTFGGSDVLRADCNRRFSCAARNSRLIHCLIWALLGRFDSRCHRRLFSCRRASLLRRTQPLLARIVVHHCLSDALTASFAMRFRISGHLRHTAPFAIIGESVLRELHFSPEVEPTKSLGSMTGIAGLFSTATIGLLTKRA